MTDRDMAAQPPATPVTIRPATAADWPGIWSVIEPMIRQGETYPLDRDLPEPSARAYWHAPDKQVFVAVNADQTIVGSYTLRPNSTGPASHVANAGYAVHPDHGGRGIGRALCLDSLRTARARGFRAMQFNLVIATNLYAIRLYHQLGFATVGTLPGAFLHPTQGYVDAFIMHRPLSDQG